MASDRNDTARPRFYMDAVKQTALSVKEGRPIFKDKEMVEVRVPGDKSITWVGVVDDEIKRRFPEQYAAFKRGEHRATTGMPLEHWPNPSLTAARVAELKGINIFSVEELAGVSDSVLPKMGIGSRELRDQAKAYIDTAKDGAKTAAMAAELTQLREMVSKLSGVPLPAPVEEVKDKAIEDCTNDELKEYIKKRTGAGVPGQPSRATLLNRAAELAQGESEAA